MVKWLLWKEQKHQRFTDAANHPPASCILATSLWILSFIAWSRRCVVAVVAPMWLSASHNSSALARTGSVIVINQDIDYPTAGKIAPQLRAIIKAY